MLKEKKIDTKKKLLITASTFPKWEDDTTPPFILELAKRLKKRFDVRLLVPYSHGSKIYEELDGLHVHRFRFFPGKAFFTDGAIMAMLKKNPLFYFQVPFFFLFQLISMRSIVKRYDVDLIHAHWIIPQGLVAVIYKKLFNKGIRITVTSHGGDVHGLKSGMLIKLKRWVINSVSSITAVSGTIKDEIIDIGLNDSIPIKVISMGVDLEKFNPKMRDDSIRDELGIAGPFLLFVGTLRELKGTRYLIEAMPDILSEFPDARLVIIGDGDQRVYLEKRAFALGLMDKSIKFLGAIPNHKLPKYYATADIFIGPSLREGLPVAFIEALGSSCTVVASSLPTISDIVIDGETGLMVRLRDSASISEKVIELLKDSALREKLGEAGRAHVSKKFGWDLIGERYADFLTEGLADG